MLSSIHDLVGQLGLSVPERGLDGLILAEAGPLWRLELVGVQATLTTKVTEARANAEVIYQLEEYDQGQSGR